MKRMNRSDELHRQKRAERYERQAKRRQQRARLIEATHAKRQRMSFSHAIAPLRHTLIAALGLSAPLGCQVESQMATDGGIMAGAEAGSTGGLDVMVATFENHRIGRCVDDRAHQAPFGAGSRNDPDPPPPFFSCCRHILPFRNSRYTVYRSGL